MVYSFYDYLASIISPLTSNFQRENEETLTSETSPTMNFESVMSAFLGPKSALQPQSKSFRQKQEMEQSDDVNTLDTLFHDGERSVTVICHSRQLDTWDCGKFLRNKLFYFSCHFKRCGFNCSNLFHLGVLNF